MKWNANDMPLFIMHKPHNNQHDQEEVTTKQCVSEFRGTVQGSLTDLLGFFGQNQEKLTKIAIRP